MHKKIIIPILIIVAASALYFGSILPLAKSRRFVAALNSMSSVKTLDEFKNHFDDVFNFYSPVGAEEISKFLGNNIISMISAKEQSENVSRYLVEYVGQHLFKDNVRHLLMFGQMHFILWQRFHQETDFVKAEEYYQRAFLIGPKLPPVLYGLFDLYAAKGDQAKAEEIGNIILKYWPEDESVKRK